MFSRPEFLDRFLSRFPDVSTLRFRALAGAGLMAGTFGALLALAAVQLDARRCAEVARAHAETLAQTAGRWLDGDAHAGLGTGPEKRLEDLTATLESLLTASEYGGTVRTLRPKPEAKAELAARPGHARAKALEVVLQTGANVVRHDVDYRPEMEAALFEGKVASVLVDGEVSAFAPLPDSWGATPALVWVSGPATAPLWRRLAFGAGALVFAGLLVSFAVWLARGAVERLVLQLGTLASGVRLLAAGRPSSAFALTDAPRELSELASSLEALRQRLEAQASGQPVPEVASAAQVERTAALGEAAEFDLGLLLQQLVEPAQKLAQNRGIDLQLFIPEGVPTQLIGHPMALYRAIDALLRRALRVTTQGSVTLRVTRTAAGPDGERLRFEVADTSAGIAFKEQQELVASLAVAATADASTLKDPLELASALAQQLGGELGFESQPGQGSRFGFTAVVRLNGPAPATTFQARAQTGFQPATRTGFRPQVQNGFPPQVSSGLPPQAPNGFEPPARNGFHAQAQTGFQPKPALPLGPPQSSFQPRPTLRTR